MRRVKVVEDHPIILVLPNGDEITAQAISEGTMRLQQDWPGEPRHLFAGRCSPHGFRVWLG